MFAGYEGLITYYVDEDGSPHDPGVDEDFDIPAQYLPHEPSCDPWFRNSSCSNDFLLLAEGSELEGPVPLITIPKDGSGNFNVDDFVVRIMSVDHQIMSSSSFSVSEDVQVILSQVENGIYAYVHYFTLYDSLARGFVRPFCLAYVTPDYSKVMHMSHELMVEFCRVSECFKSGNQLVFFRDMAHTLSDLQFTRERYLECQHSLGQNNGTSNMADIASTPEELDEEKALQLIQLHELDASIAEVKNILKILNEMFEKADQNTKPTVCQNIISKPGDTPLDSNNFRITHDLNANRKDGLDNGVCSHLMMDFSEATFQMLTNICESYKPMLKTNLKPTIQKSLRSIHELCQNRAKQGLDYLHNIYKYFKRDTATLLLEREDSTVLDPTCSLLTIGRTVYLNFLNDFDMFGNSGCPVISPRVCSLVCTPTGSLGHRWQSCDTLNSFYSCDSQDSFVSCSDPLSFQSPHVTTTDLPSGERSHLDVTRAVIEMKTMNKNNSDSTGFLPPSTCDMSSRPKTLDLSQTNNHQKPTQVSVISISDHILNLKETSCGIGKGILQFVKQYSFAVHLLYSLLCGRPVVILGSVSFEKEIRDLVTALWMFLPGHSKSSYVMPWTTVPLKLSDLTNLKLCGLGKPEKKSYDWMVPKNLKSYATLLYYDRKKSLWSPRYEGGILNDIVQMSQNFDCDGSYISFMHSKLFQLALKSYRFFHGFCMRKSAGFVDGLELIPRQQAWVQMSQSFAKQLDLTECDQRIVERLADVILEQQMKEIEVFQSETSSQIHLDHQPCHQFSA